MTRRPTSTSTRALATTAVRPKSGLYYITSTRPTLLAGDSMANIVISALIGANTNTGLLTLYTVPSGYEFYPSSFDLSCNSPVKQRFDFYEGATLRWPRGFFNFVQLIDSDLGIIPKTAGTNIGGIIYNNDSVPCRFIGTTWGTLVKVP